MESDRRATVVTPRLVLTPITADDVDDLLVLHADPQVARWTGPWTRATVRDWVTTMAERWRSDGVGKWMARDRLTGALIGRGGPSRIELDGVEVLEIGWAVRDAMTGRGYATEIGEAALDWAARFAPALEVVAFTEIHNHASRAVMERLGMAHERVILREGLIEGDEGLHDAAPFALYRAQRWRSAAARMPS